MKFLFFLVAAVSLEPSRILFADEVATQEEPKWAPAEIQMTAASAKEFISVLADHAKDLGDWGKTLEAKAIKSRKDVVEASCTARVIRPRGANILPMSETKNNRIECIILKPKKEMIAVTLSLADSPLDNWGTHFQKNAFTISGKRAELLFKALQKELGEIPADANERMLTADFLCDPFFDFCLDGYTVQQTPVIGDNMTASGISCNRETDFSKETKEQFKIHYLKYNEQANLGEAAAAAAKKEYLEYRAKVFGNEKDQAMLEDQLSRGVRVLSKLNCLWMETD